MLPVRLSRTAPASGLKNLTRALIRALCRAPMAAQRLERISNERMGHPAMANQALASRLLTVLMMWVSA
jgi:hypothetical protein